MTEKQSSKYPIDEVQIKFADGQTMKLSGFVLSVEVHSKNEGPFWKSECIFDHSGPKVYDIRFQTDDYGGRGLPGVDDDGDFRVWRGDIESQQ